MKSYTPSTSESQLVGVWVGEYHAESAGTVQVKFCFFQLDSESLATALKGDAKALSPGAEALVGIYQSGSGAFGVVTGTIEGSAFTAVANQTTPGCPATFEMTGTVEGTSFEWRFKGTDCLGDEDGRGLAQRVI